MNWVKVAGASGAAAVCMGAFGAHYLKGKVDERFVKACETASHYHLVHSAALLAVPHIPATYRNVAGGLFLSGMVLFSGSLYAMALTENRKFGAITPIGGVCFIAGWIALCLA